MSRQCWRLGRIDDEWSRQQPVSRVYYSLMLEDGPVVTILRNSAMAEWYLQH
jgi:hypothetical protein